MKSNTWRRWVTESTRPSYGLLRFLYLSSSTRPRREYPSSGPQKPPLFFSFFQRYCRRSSSGPGGVSSFSDFSLSDLQAATNNFSSDFIVSESGEKAPSVVYKGRFQNQSNRRWIAVNKFTKLAWPDAEQFEDEARGVGKLRHKRVANLIGIAEMVTTACLLRSLCPTIPSLSVYSTLHSEKLGLHLLSNFCFISGCVWVLIYKWNLFLKYFKI